MAKECPTKPAMSCNNCGEEGMPLSPVQNASANKPRAHEQGLHKSKED